MEPLRFSQLKMMAKSPAHYRHYVDHDSKSSPSMQLGSATHAILLGQPHVLYEGIRRGKKWDAFKEENPDKLIMIQSELDTAGAMAKSVERSPRAMELLQGTVEQTIFWENGPRECRGTPDVRSGSRIVELKTCRTSEPERFQRAAISYAYHAQLAWYLEGVRLSGLGTPHQAFIVAVESSAPYPVTVHCLSDRTLDMGQRLCRIWLERLRVCEDANYWPGYVESEVSFDSEDELRLTIDGEELIT